MSPYLKIANNRPSKSIPCGCVCRRVSYHYQRCLKSLRMTLEETAPESPRHPLTSTVGGRQRGAGHGGIATSVNLGRRYVNIPRAAQTGRAYLTAADVQV